MPAVIVQIKQWINFIGRMFPGGVNFSGVPRDRFCVIRYL
jgi:hypothetical protein